jgi:hypothetical protein
VYSFEVTTSTSNLNAEEFENAKKTNIWLKSLRVNKHRTVSHEQVVETLRAIRDEPTTYHEF